MNTYTREKNITRRSFLGMSGWGAFFLAAVISFIGSIRFLFPRVLFEPPSTFRVGLPDMFHNDSAATKNGCQVYENWKEQQSVWIIRENSRLYAVHAKCTHLGCTPRWFSEEQVFKCPCHGSQFTGSGVNFAGPAPRPLDRFHIYLDDNGMICVDKSRVYTFKEYDQPGAYVTI